MVGVKTHDGSHSEGKFRAIRKFGLGVKGGKNVRNGGEKAETFKVTV